MNDAKINEALNLYKRNKFATGGEVVGSLAALTNVLENKPPFPEIGMGDDMINKPSVPTRSIQALAEGGEAGGDAEVVPNPNPPEDAKLAPSPEDGVRERSPVEADAEAEGRAKELEAVVKEIDGDEALIEEEKTFLRSQAYKDGGTKGLPAAALRANYLTRKGAALERTKMKAAPKEAPPAPAPTEAPKAEEVKPAEAPKTEEVKPAEAPVAEAPKPITGSDLRSQTIDATDAGGRSPLAVVRDQTLLAQELGDKAYNHYRSTRAQVLSDLGGVANPTTPEEFAKNRELEATADNIALTTARQYKSLLQPAERPTLPKDTTAAPAPAAPAAPTTPAPVTPAADITPTPAGKVVAKPEVVKSALYNAAKKTGMTDAQAETFVKEFEPRLANVEADKVLAAADELIATDPRAKAVTSAANDFRVASANKLLADKAIADKSVALNDAAAQIEGAAALDLQRKLMTAQAQGSALRAEILADIRASEKYLKDSSPNPVATLLGIIGAGLGSKQSYQDWFDKRVDSELKKQYDLMDKKKTLLGLYMDQTKDLDDAYKLTEASVKRVLAAQTQAQLGLLQSEKAKAEATLAAKKLEMDAAKAEEEVLTKVSERQKDQLLAAVDKQKADLLVAKEVLDTFQAQKLAGIHANAASGRAEAAAGRKAEEKAGPPAWGKALRGEKLTDSDVEELGKWDDKKRAQLVTVLKPVKTVETINGHKVQIFTLAPSKGLSVLARSTKDADEIRKTDIATGDMMRNWNIMSRIAAKYSYNKAKLLASAEKADYETALRSVIAGFSELYKTGVISGGEYDRYKAQADAVDFAVRDSVASNAFSSFGQNLADSNATVRANRLQKSDSGTTGVDISRIPQGHIKALQAKKTDAAVRAEFDRLYGAGAAAAALGE